LLINGTGTEAANHPAKFVFNPGAGTMTKKTRIALFVAAAALATPMASHADTAFNIGAVTDYRYRGISQSRLKPALQGGIDYTNGGFYLGTWASTIKWIKDAGEIFGTGVGNANLELDLYGGYKGEITKEFGYDVGVLSYVYPRNKLGNLSPLFKNADTTEIYGALTYGPATLKYSHAVTNLFGNPDSKNSYYLDLAATFDVSGFSVTPHIGYQKVKGPYDEAATYTDYGLTVAKEVSKGLTVSLALIGTDADKAWYVSPSGKFLGKTTGVLGIKYAF
jgi:uncharacterized protein (TIGR02001 family)